MVKEKTVIPEGLTLLRYCTRRSLFFLRSIKRLWDGRCVFLTCVFLLVKLPSSDIYWDRVSTRSRSLLSSSRLWLIRESETRTERVYHEVNGNPGIQPREDVNSYAWSGMTNLAFLAIPLLQVPCSSVMNKPIVNVKKLDAAYHNFKRLWSVNKKKYFFFR